MRLHIFVLTALVVVSLVPGAALGQDVNETAANATVDLDPRDPARGCDEHVDNHTSICSVSLDDDGRAVLVLYSDRYQRITVTDATALLEGGEISERTPTLKKDRRTTVRISVTEVGGYQAVGLDTGRTKYGVLIEEPSHVLPGSPGTWDPLVSAVTLFVLFGTALPVCYVWQKRSSGGRIREL